MNLSYTLSSQLKEILVQIDEARTHILLAPLPIKEELHIRWDALITRVFHGLQNTGTPVTRADVAHTLAEPAAKKPDPRERAIWAYKQALEAIAQDWLAVDKPVTPATIAALYSLACEETFGKLTGFRSQEKLIAQGLAYLESEQEHPVVQAANAYLLIKTSPAFGQAAERMAILTCYLFLYRRGFDVRGAITFEEELYGNSPALNQAITHAETTGSATLMLEHTARAIASSLQKTAGTIRTHTYAQAPGRGFFRLSEREKAILASLTQPEATITNRLVQKRFKVSQITASRDLAKLASLGLLYPHGKGRSTYYMKI